MTLNDSVREHINCQQKFRKENNKEYSEFYKIFHTFIHWIMFFYFLQIALNKAWENNLKWQHINKMSLNDDDNKQQNI